MADGNPPLSTPAGSDRSLRDARQVWLSLAPNVNVAVPYSDAVAWSEDDFVGLYLKHVYGAKRDEAETWAERQVEERDAHLEGREPRVERG